MEKKKLLTFIGLGIGLYLVSTGVSFASFNYLKTRGVQEVATPVSSERESGFKIDTSAPKTEICPLNGAKFTKAERDIWEKRRPLAASIENHVDSRPPSGLSRADIVYEVVAEGGITRFLSVFYCGVSAADTRIGPIRSARIYLINWVAEYGKNPLFVHVGGANNICQQCPGGVKLPGTVAPEVLALEKLINMGWRSAVGNALDGGANVGFPIIWRDPERIPNAATEHTVMGSTDKLFAEGIKRGFGFTGSDGKKWNENFAQWKFADDKPLASPSASTISFGFWDNQPLYDVTWKYDRQNNRYLRFDGGKEHTDMETGVQLSAKNVVIQFVEERGPVDKEGHMFEKNIGSGNALFFQNGGMIKGTWSKDSQTDRTEFFNDQDTEISFVRGQIWIEALPKGNKVQY